MAKGFFKTALDTSLEIMDDPAIDGIIYVFQPKEKKIMPCRVGPAMKIIYRFIISCLREKESICMFC